jgi:prolyl 4-hydroxylase
MQLTRPSAVAAAEQLVAAGRTPEAVLLLNRAGSAGDGDALFTLALWRLGGQLMPRDLAQARELFRRAGEAGRADAAKIYGNLLANGTGGPCDWQAAMARLKTLARRDRISRAELDIIERMDLTPEGNPRSVPEAKPLSESPWVARIPGLFTAAECDYLAKAAEPMLEPSVVVDERSGRQIPHPIRTSDGAAFAWVIENPAVHALNRRIAAASGTLVAQGEPLQVLRYRPGQQYRNHLDAVPGLDNHRVMTMLVYLNEGYEGGETRFVRTGLAVKGRKGDGLLFRNTLPDGRADPMSEHAGMPVTAGAKIIASRWIWEQDFAPPPPRRG